MRNIKHRILLYRGYSLVVQKLPGEIYVCFTCLVIKHNGKTTREVVDSTARYEKIGDAIAAAIATIDDVEAEWEAEEAEEEEQA